MHSKNFSMEFWYRESYLFKATIPAVPQPGDVITKDEDSFIVSHRQWLFETDELNLRVYLEYKEE